MRLIFENSSFQITSQLSSFFAKYIHEFGHGKQTIVQGYIVWKIENNDIKSGISLSF